jgi:UDP-N-acetylglucosamine--N-acetylmuramyl-(pentapeptide) pyrophosphoryl-undecaprenol N-acetylglucosamine transferase
MKFILACGGTGGHVYPALAIADELKLQGHTCGFVGRVDGMEKRLVGERFPYFGIPAYPLKRGKLKENLTLPWRLAKSFSAAVQVLKREKPAAVIGTGGYVSLPTLVAAKWLKIPVYLQEQNLYAGIANRIASHWARKIFVVAQDAVQAFPSGKSLVTGNPTRAIPSELPAPELFRAETFNLLVLGGSQGARGVNLKVQKALEQWKNDPSIRVIWQTGPSTLAEFQHHEEPGKIQVSAYLDPIYPAIAHADLVISRAGASTISELLAFGKPAIFVPFPHAAEDHQTKNAMSLVRAGAALCEGESENPELDIKVAKLRENPSTLKTMSIQSKALDVPGSAQTIAHWMIQDLENKQ